MGQLLGAPGGKRLLGLVGGPSGGLLGQALGQVRRGGQLGGAAGGDTDLSDAVRTAVINKRAGGMGLILGRKAFKKSMADGVKLINAVQDVYLDSKVTIA